MSVEACYLTSKSMAKTLDLGPIIKVRGPSLLKKRCCLSLHRNGSTPSSVTCCSLRTQPDDDREPIIDSDWRSFRARLVATQKQQMAGPQSTGLISDKVGPRVPLGTKWVHPIHEPEKGCLLIATEKLDGVHIFEKAVILLLSMGPVGPSGIILNRPSLMSIKEMRSTDLDVAGIFSNQPLFFGGPLEDGLFLVGPQGADRGGVGKSGVFEEVLKGLYYGTKESVGCAAEMVKRDVVGVGDFRFFDGYCGWEREQLSEEIRAGYWTLVACSPNVIGLNTAGDVGLWDDILGLIGQRKVW